MSIKHKNKAKKRKTTLVFLFVIFLISIFVNNKENGATNHSTQHYPQEIKTAIDSLLEFFDEVDSTLNILRERDDFKTE
jgi:SNF family Na+-dependent transporter